MDAEWLSAYVKEGGAPDFLVIIAPQYAERDAMGILSWGVESLLDLTTKTNLAGSVLQIGRQDVYSDRNNLLKILHHFGYVSRINSETYSITDPRISSVFSKYRNLPDMLSNHITSEYLRRFNFISDEALFNIIGFDEVFSVDIGSHDNPTYICDLNDRNLLEVTNRKFNAVFDGGSMEHVFSTRDFLANIFDVLEVGGHVIHVVPANNHVEHGFFQFSPCFFRDYYKSNNYEVVCNRLIRYSREYEKNPLAMDPFFYSDYNRERFHEHTIGALDDSLYQVFFCARKTQNSTCDKKPQQNSTV